MNMVNNPLDINEIVEHLLLINQNKQRIDIKQKNINIGNDNNDTNQNKQEMNVNVICDIIMWYHFVFIMYVKAL